MDTARALLLAAAVASSALAASPAAVTPQPLPAADASACNRACLESFVDRYLDAVVANQPAAVPLAPGVRFTENGVELAIGDGLWNTLRATGRYRIFVTDVPAGQVAFFGTIEEDHRDPAQGTPALLNLRLKVRGLQVTQVEQIVYRDEAAARRVESLTPLPLYVQPVHGGLQPARERQPVDQCADARGPVAA